MLDWNRFYVPFSELENARSLTEDLFSDSPAE